MVCSSCKTETNNLIYIESHHDLIDTHVCPICLAKIDRIYLREGINAEFIVTDDKMFLTNKYHSFRLPIRRVEKQNNRFVFNLEEEPNWDYLFSTIDNKVIRLRSEYRKKVKK
jgi:hypothetical protein